MEFITVSKDMKAQVQMNAASYGNANKMVVLIDEEKLERMATDENFRKKYEGIIATSQAKMMQAKMGLTSSGASVKNFGMSVDSLDDLLSKVQTYSYNNASGKVMTESEKMVGTKIDFRG